MDFHGIPWSSMEFDGIFSMEFHGVLGHGFPWNSMEYFPTSFPWSSMEFHGKRVPGRVSLKVTQSPSKDKCLETDRLSFSF